MPSYTLVALDAVAVNVRIRVVKRGLESGTNVQTAVSHPAAMNVAGNCIWASVTLVPASVPVPTDFANPELASFQKLFDKVPDAVPIKAPATPELTTLPEANELSTDDELMPIKPPTSALPDVVPEA